ncbi:fatty acid synthase [Trichonephila clavipes]|nr:fatty acid synthase [Trichonephila clavipes]
MALQSRQKQIPLKSISLLNGSEELMSVLSEENSRNRDLEVEALCRFVDQFVHDDAFKAKSPQTGQVKYGLCFLSLAVALRFAPTSSVRSPLASRTFCTYKLTCVLYELCRLFSVLELRSTLTKMMPLTAKIL